MLTTPLHPLALISMEIVPTRPGAGQADQTGQSPLYTPLCVSSLFFKIKPCSPCTLNELQEKAGQLSQCVRKTCVAICGTFVCLQETFRLRINGTKDIGTELHQMQLKDQTPSTLPTSSVSCLIT
jgi:hypothetical protein